MRCFSIKGDRVTKGLSIIPSPFPHIGIGMHGCGQDYMRIGVSSKFAMSLVVRPKQYEVWCRNSRQEHGCPRAKLKAACGPGCPDRVMERRLLEAEYTDLLECCMVRTISGSYLLVEARRPDQRGLVHMMLHGSDMRATQFVREYGALDAGDTGSAECGNGISIIASRTIGEKDDVCNEYLIIMQPRAAVGIFRTGCRSDRMQAAAYYDGTDIRTFCLI